MSRVLVIGDVHEPVSHPGYLSFCKDLYEEWGCNEVIFIGDIVDWHAISSWVKEPNCPGPKDEYELSSIRVRKWYETFPNAKVCIGNHDERPERLAKTVSIPPCLLKDYNTVWNTSGWNWSYDFIVDDVYYYHGTSASSFQAMHPAWNTMSKMLMSVVMGHYHSRAGIKWKANPFKRIFGMDVGCGIDVTAWQFVYGKHIKERPILSAGIIIDGIPYHEVMPCSEGERYHKSRFLKRRPRGPNGSKKRKSTRRRSKK